jgi:16S rRNA G1207 methylase RsmC
MKRYRPGWEHESEGLLAALDQTLRPPATVLEVGAGTGQLAIFFAEKMPSITWLPSEREPELVDSIAAWRAEAALPNLKKPLLVDTTAADWDVAPVSAIVAIHFVEAVPWAATVGLVRGAERVLLPGGDLLLVGAIPEERRGDLLALAMAQRFELVQETEAGRAGPLLVLRLR